MHLCSHQAVDIKKAGLSTGPFCSNVLFPYMIFSISGVTSKKTGANTKETIAINFNRILSDGPEVSLNGSPTLKRAMTI